MGAKPSGKGYGGCPFTPTKVSLFEKGRPSPTITKAGVEGAQPPPRGHGGCAPQNFKEGASSQPLQPRQEWGPKRWWTLSPRGWAKGGPGGEAPWQGAVGGVPPQYQRGASSQPLQPRHEWGPKRWQTPSPRGWAKGVQGAVPPGRGFGRCAPKILKKGQVANSCTPAKSGAQNSGEPAAHEGG
jgi:hypothetical protein